MEKRLPEGLEGILSNNTSGSTEILERLNSFFLNNPEKIHYFGEYIITAMTGLSSFASIQSYLNELKRVLENKGTEEVRLFLLKTAENMTSFYKRLYKNAKPVLGSYRSIITISNSHTLSQIFKLLHEDDPALKVIVPESRAKMEGRIMAEKLLGFGIHVELISDVMIAEFTALSDAAIIGADMVLETGNVVNKSGSMLLALAARHYNKPFIVLTGKNKFSSANNYAPEENPSEEVWRFSHENLIIRNHYFEEVENSLITHILTD